MKQFLSYLLIVLMIFQGCSDEDPVKGSDREYFPLQTGFYQLYDVVEKEYKNQAPPDVFVYELKSEVVDSFANLEGGYTFVIHRSKRSTSNDPWQFQEAWSARTTPSQAVVTEGNVAYVRLVFPVLKSKEWNGNALNAFEVDSYQIESVGKPYELESDVSFEDALVINQHDELNALRRDQREEVYARNAGLIYKKSTVLNYCDDGEDGGCFGQQIIKDGIEYVQILKEYGQN